MSGFECGHTRLLEPGSLRLDPSYAGLKSKVRHVVLEVEELYQLCHQFVEMSSAKHQHILEKEVLSFGRNEYMLGQKR